MRRTLFILLLSVLRMCGVNPCPAQLTAPAPVVAVDSGYWISKADITAAMNGINRQRDTTNYLVGRINIYKELTDSLKAQVRDLKQRADYKSQITEIALRQRLRDEEIIDSYKKENKDLKSSLDSWLRSPWLWLAIGAAAMFFIQK